MKKLEQKQQNERQQKQRAVRQQLGEWLLQILFPRRCPVCDGIVRPAGENMRKLIEEILK